ncbi:LPXTG-motif cell wall anchor domain-containing protein [Agromyces sp. CF514]|uniref:LPXTG cell wall anchor domain-containing protein n=1 Tax=Agromyces sp. CF514 TaxID=1881031 RepID=UPI0008E54FF4|nr:LPXTG cell wall anchor domain-containing protein [Agromyces sp. CF514]SFR90649.1 LPXTG-motif cell wall anchor domain-containing protein [Agromyces sp. CF514]
MRATTAGILLAAALVLVGGQAAYAEEIPPSPDPGYVPEVPVEPSLGGSTAVGVCDNDAPYIFFSVELTDPDGVATSNFARLILSGAGGQTMEIPLGELQGGSLSGSVLWPGASVDENGNANGWPGWAFVNGQWVETTGNFAWTRSVSSAMIVVNPEVTVPLSYPPATPACTDPGGSTPAGDMAVDTVNGESLPHTGVAAWTLPLGLAALGAAVVGLVLVLMRRRRTSTSTGTGTGTE